jgi:hypothetical protein
MGKWLYNNVIISSTKSPTTPRYSYPQVKDKYEQRCESIFYTENVSTKANCMQILIVQWLTLTAMTILECPTSLKSSAIYSWISSS